MDAIEALRARRSVRAYKDTPVDSAHLETIVDCGRLASSARNEQPWEFVVVTDAEQRRRIAGATDHGKFIADAPACIAVLCKEADYYLEDGCAATQNMLVAARALGLGSCWVAGDRKPYAETVLRILEAPAGLHLVSLIAIGHPASVPTPVKRSLEEVLHWEHF
ncbi:MAG: nitroreductase family protein [Candidatus Hydrogenedentota bacterium]